MSQPYIRPRSMHVLVITPDSGAGGEVPSQPYLKVTLMKVATAQAGPESFAGVIRRIVLAPLQVAQRVRHERFDLVHLNTSLVERSLLCDSLILLALRLFGYRRVLAQFHHWRTPLEARLRKTVLLKRVIAWLLNATACVVVPASECMQGLMAMGVEPKRIAVAQSKSPAELEALYRVITGS